MSSNLSKRPNTRLRLFNGLRPSGVQARTVLTLFGTRPEAIKLAPVIRELETRGSFETLNVSSGQHTDLLYPFVRSLGIRVDRDLHVMSPNQSPNQVCARVMSAMDVMLEKHKPDLILVQGDTTTALAGALAGFHREVPVGHVEAGLRSGNPLSPFPEEMNRRMISRIATYHFAATARNRMTLLSEGMEKRNIFVTGNTVVDSLKSIMRRSMNRSSDLEEVLMATSELKRIVLTTHRRESFGESMIENLRTIRRFVESNNDVALIFPVHPNPAVGDAARATLSHHPRIHLIAPLGYQGFIALLSEAWLIVSDSGGVQEEAPTLGKPLLILRENTERPEALESGVARLVGSRRESLGAMLAEAYREGSWIENVERIENPFGDGKSGERIAGIIADVLNVEVEFESRVASL